MNQTSIPSVSFIETINSLVELSPEARHYIESNHRTTNFSPKETLVFNESKSGRLYFIHIGLARSYYQNEKEQTANGWLGWEGYFIPQPFHTPSHSLVSQVFEFLEESTLSWLGRAELDELYKLHPATKNLELLVERQIRCRYDEWLRAFRELTSGELADWFMERYAKMGLRLSGRNLGLFVGITPEGLSKHRANKR